MIRLKETVFMDITIPFSIITNYAIVLNILVIFSYKKVN
jgi:hypothetical protein